MSEIIIGIDPGSRFTGYGIVRMNGNEPVYIGSGCIKTGDGDLASKSNLEERYQECWKHHYTVNAHHPEHWLDHENNTCTDMTLEAIVEMICDWEAMSLKFGTSTLKWYETADDEKRCFSVKTKEIVEDLMYNVIHNSVSNSL